MGALSAKIDLRDVTRSGSRGACQSSELAVAAPSLLLMQKKEVREESGKVNGGD